MLTRMIPFFIGQEGGGGIDVILLLLPLLCCLLSIGQRGESSQDSIIENETFYCILNIDESFNEIEKLVEKWRQTQEQKEESTIRSKVMNLFKKDLKEERFEIIEKIPNRLLKLSDVPEPIYFEFIDEKHF